MANRGTAQGLNRNSIADVFHAATDYPTNPAGFAAEKAAAGAPDLPMPSLPPTVLQTGRGGTTSILPAGATAPTSTIRGEPFPAVPAKAPSYQNRLIDMVVSGDEAGARKAAAVIRESSRMQGTQETPENRVADLVLAGNMQQARALARELSVSRGKPETPKVLDEDLGKQYLAKAGGDVEKAKQLAAQDGYTEDTDGNPIQ